MPPGGPPQGYPGAPVAGAPPSGSDNPLKSLFGGLDRAIKGEAPAVADAGAPAGEEGAAPEGYEGGPPEGGQGQVPQFEEGTPEHAVQTVVLQVTKGDLTGLDAVISERATGVLGQMRDAKVSDEKLAELKEQMSQVRLLNRRGDGASYHIFLRNGQNEVLQFTCRREGEGYRVRELAVHDAPSQRRRR